MHDWWAARFLNGVAGGDPARTNRGRSYARGGAVGPIEVDVVRGRASARVRGSRARAYLVSITFWKVGESAWERILADLAAEPEAAEELLSGELPEELEDIFADHGARLFPDALGDLDFSCDCPDWGHPCKHVAALLFALADLFDDDPFGLLAVLGREAEEVIGALDVAPTRQAGELAVEAAPPADRVGDFWAHTPPTPLEPVRHFDALAHWEGSTSGVADRLARMYAQLG